MINIALPTRGRPQNLKRLLYSLAENADEKDRVVPIIRVDTDDPTLSEYEKVLEEIHEDHPEMLWVYLVGEPKQGISKMVFECLNAARGTVIMFSGDDMVFGSKGFDTLVLEMMPIDNIGLVWGADGFQNQNLPTHPFIGRSFFEFLPMKYAIPFDYTGDFLDTHVFDIFLRLKAKGHNRMAYVPYLVTEHLHPAAGKAEMDDTYRNKISLKDSQKIFEKKALQREHASAILEVAIKSGINVL